MTGVNRPTEEIRIEMLKEFRCEHLRMTVFDVEGAPRCDSTKTYCSTHKFDFVNYIPATVKAQAKAATQSNRNSGIREIIFTGSDIRNKTMDELKIDFMRQLNKAEDTTAVLETCDAFEAAMKKSTTK
jgi:hypothetical protein